MTRLEQTIGLRQALSSEPVPPEPSLITTLLDCLVLPGMLRFTRLGYWVRKPCFAPLAVSLEGRTVVITGATSGLGHAAAENLARLGARVILVGRDAQRTKQAREAIRSDTGNTNLGVEIADLSRLSDVRRLGERLLARERVIHVLVNNAAVLENERRVTAEGIETSLATNLLAPFILTRQLLPRLRESAPSRIINVVSGGMYLAGLVRRRHHRLARRRAGGRAHQRQVVARPRAAPGGRASRHRGHTGGAKAVGRAAIAVAAADPRPADVYPWRSAQSRTLAHATGCIIRVESDDVAGRWHSTRSV